MMQNFPKKLKIAADDIVKILNNGISANLYCSNLCFQKRLSQGFAGIHFFFFSLVQNVLRGNGYAKEYKLSRFSISLKRGNETPKNGEKIPKVAILAT